MTQLLRALSQPPHHRRAALAGDRRLASVRPRAEGNGVAEWFIKQLKEQLLWCERFATVAQADAAVRAFCRRFRDEWIVERLGYRTPAEAYAAFIAERAA
jgi:hypothetical protein